VAAIVNKTSQAERDITSAIYFLFGQNPQAAERFVFDLEAMIRRLEQFQNFIRSNDGVCAQNGNMFGWQFCAGLDISFFTHAKITKLSFVG
jgi:hypothetical protein